MQPRCAKCLEDRLIFLSYSVVLPLLQDSLGATHSQAFENWFANCPGLKVVVPSTPYDAKGLLKSAIRDNDPVIFMESEQMYGDKGEVPEEEYTIPLGVADIKREGKDVTIVSFGKIIKEAFIAAEELAKEGIEM